MVDPAAATDPRRAGRSSEAGSSRAAVAAVVAGLLILLGAIWLTIVTLVDREREELLRYEAARNSNLALAHEQQLSAALQLVDDKLVDLRREVARSGPRIEMGDILGEGRALGNHVVSAFILDAHGDAVTAWNVRLDGVNYSDRAYFTAHRNTASDALYVDAPLLGRVTGRWVVVLSRRLAGPDGSFQGVVAIALDPAYFARLYEATDLGARGSLAMIGLDGITRVRRNGAEVSFGQNVASSQLFSELKQRRAGSYIARAASDGVVRVVAFRQMAHYPMVAVVASATEDVLASLRARQPVYVSVGVVLSLLLVGLAALVLRQLRSDRRLIRQIRAGEQRYRLIFENDLAGVIRMRPDGQIIETNPALRAMFGYSEAELLQRSAYSLLDPDDPRIQRIRADRQATGRAAGEVTGRRADGSLFELDAASVTYVDESGAPGVLVVMRDITERKALQREQQKLVEILDASPDFIGMAALDGSARFINAAGRRMLGLADDAEPVSIAACHPAWAAERVLNEGIPQAMHSGTWTGESAILMADGRELPVLQTVICHRDERGQPKFLSTVTKDVTPLKEAEQARRATAVAEQANRQKSEFMSRMSHELRTPLNAILGFSELLQVEGAPPLLPQQATQVRHIHSAGEHLLALIDDLLDLSRLEAGTLRLALQRIDLLHLARALVQESGPLAGERRVSMKVESDGRGAVWARGDVTRVRQVLGNLLSNAIKYGAAGGTVTVRLQGDEAQVQLAVIDQGEGLSAEQLQRLFQPFERLGREQSRVKGTGIGLVISRALAELMGGTLEACSELGRGSTFVLTLQAAAADESSAAAGATAAGAAAPALGPAAAARLLYVDDIEANRVLMAGLVATRPQWQLVLAAAGPEGLAAARAQRPDLVLADIRMPGMDGFAFLEALRADGTLADVPCIAVSAHAMPAEIDAALEAGFVAYVTKPIDARVLIDTITRHLPH